RAPERGARRPSRPVRTGPGPWFRWPSAFTTLTSNESGLHGQLVLRTGHRLAGEPLVDAGQLEHDATGLDVGDPPLGRALAGAHAGLGGLLGQRPVREDVDPDLAAALDVTGHRDTSRLDLAVGDVGALEGLDPVVTEIDRGAALGHAAARGLVLLAVLGPPGDEHGSGLRSGLCRGLGGRRAAGSLRGCALLARLAATLTAAPGATAPATRCAGRSVRLLAGVLLLGHVTLVDPDLHADPAEGRAGLEEPEVDVGAQGVQGDASLAVELRARHLRAAEAAGALHPDALGTGALRGLHALAHGATERDAAGELLGDALCDQLSVQLGVLHLEDVQLNLLAGELLQLAAQPVRLRTAATDDDARTRGVQIHAHAVPCALDVDLGDPGPLETGGHQPPDRHVLADVVAVPLSLLGAVGEPTGAVIGGDTEPESGRVDLLTHYRALP